MATNVDWRVSDILVSKIMEFQGCRLTAYLCLAVSGPSVSGIPMESSRA